LLAAGSGLATALFLGGGSGPLLPGWVWSVLKTTVVLAALVAVRWRLPVLRADRVVGLAWLVVLPLVLVQVLVVSVLAVGRG
jgi:NADH-quinone oxidoreductase subunit H